MMRARQRRELQSSIRKTRVLDKAGTLFWQKGYHSTSMRDIAEACNFQPANIYHYFESKEDILYDVIKDITEQTVSSIQHLEDDEVTSPEEQLRSLIKSHFGLIVKMKRSSVLISDTGLKDLSPKHRKEIIGLRDKYDGIMRRVIRRGVERGNFVVKDEKVVCFFISSVIMRSNIWFSPNGRLSGDEVGDMMFDFVLRGIKSGG
ncbi:MAG: TetR/AcrR family transcriptional regulator [Chloroflexi bacterium]|nr:TetR/AcrR family transcriptional regulator [Chloroflexota bacterium]